MTTAAVHWDNQTSCASIYGLNLDRRFILNEVSTTTDELVAILQAIRLAQEKEVSKLAAATDALHTYERCTGFQKPCSFLGAKNSSGLMER